MKYQTIIIIAVLAGYLFASYTVIREGKKLFRRINQRQEALFNEK